MSFTVVCSACGARFALTDDLYERKFKDRIVTVRCKHCGADINVDGVELASAPQHEAPSPASNGDQKEEAALDLTPTVPLAQESPAGWTVSFGPEDDREIDRDQIAQALKRGEIDADTLVWREGMDEWLPLGDVDALADLVTDDATGGFLGTGMELDGAKLKKKRPPPPHPAKRSSSPPEAGAKPAAKPPPLRRKAAFGDAAGKTSGKAHALSPGTLFVKESKPGETGPRKPKLPTPPKAPVPEWKANLPDPPPSSEEIPPSSGTPALQDLMTALKPAEEEKPERTDADVLGISNDPGSLLAPPAFDLGPPTIDVESPAPGEVSGDDDAEAQLQSEPAPAPDIADKHATESSNSGRRIAGVLLIGTAAAFGVWWFGLRTPRSGSTPPATASAASAESPKPAPPTPQNAAAAKPTASAASAGSAEPPVNTPAETAHATAAPAQPPGADHARSPTKHAKTRPEKHASASKPSPAATAPEPKSEPTATASASAAPAKPLPPFNRTAAISALGAAAGAASSCRKQSEPSGTAHVVITFAPSGRVTTARVNGPPYAGTPTGGCIASRMRSAHVPPFSGGFVTVSKTVIIR